MFILRVLHWIFTPLPKVQQRIRQLSWWIVVMQVSISTGKTWRQLYRQLIERRWRRDEIKKARLERRLSRHYKRQWFWHNIEGKD